jgi:putative transcriptional regulator
MAYIPPMKTKLLTVVETPTYLRQVFAIWTDDERAAFVDFIARNPEVGDVIPDTGGVCKVRWGRSDSLNTEKIMSTFGKELIESLAEARAHAEGDSEGVRIHVVEVPDVREIRKHLRMSQQEFASAYRIPLATLKNWEQGRRQPDAPAAAYLQVIARRPQEIREALAVQP